MGDDGEIRDQWALAIAERDRLRSALLDILVVESLDSAHSLANGALDAVPSELDQAVEHADLRDERDRMRAALGDISRIVMPDIGHGGNYGFVVQATERAVVERNRLRAVVVAAETLVSELDANPIGEYGDAVCEAIDQLDAALKAAKEGT